MKISNNWLKEYIDHDLDPQQLEEKLTFAGIEVEAVERIGAELEQIKIASILEKKAHPDADHLSICLIDDGNETVQVICGAPNCAAGQKVAFAPVGTQVGEFKIKKVKLRGEVSFGMICSEKELGISENHDGIMVLPKEAPLGCSLASYLKLNDTCFDLEITPNRPDLLGIFGVARDLSAVLKLPLIAPDTSISEASEKIEDYLQLQNDASHLCTRYTARMIKGVTIAESPEWLKRRLISVGLRPINNVVDITNFVMLEYGHPLHAFDYQLIKDQKIIVRTAADKEEFPALDEEIYQLDKTDLVIADNQKAIALAGVIGGENSHITASTQDIVIEAANFLYSTIRKTASRLKISTDSSYRFERDIADETADLVSRRAVQLILRIAGGRLLKGKLDSFPKPAPKTVVPLRLKRVENLLTLKLSSVQIKNYLKPLGLEIEKEDGGTLHFSIPPFRKDLRREVDLIEEVIRLHGYNKVQTFLKPQKVMNHRVFYAKRNLTDMLVNYGFSEVKNWHFSDPEDLDKLQIAADDFRRNWAKIRNPLGSRFSIMRPLLLTQLLGNALYNINHGQKDLKLFEMTKTFSRKDQKLAEERVHLGGIVTGKINPIQWKEKARKADFYDLKGILDNMLDSLQITGVEYTASSEPYYQPGHSADLWHKDLKLGHVGRIDQKIAASFEIELDIFAFELDLENVFQAAAIGDVCFKSYPRYPAVLRDLSFIISTEYNYNDIVQVIYSVDPKIIRKVQLFDEFKGKNIKPGYRSLTFKIVFNSDTKTLTDEMINLIFQKTIKKLTQEFEVELR